MKLKGKIALVTGATSGIGAETARSFAREGAIVILSGRDTARGEAVRAELGGDKHRFIAADLGGAHAAKCLADAACAQFGRIDILVNNAGVVYHKTVPQTSDEEWDSTLAVNVSTVFYLSRAILPEMLERGDGVIVNVASTYGLVGAAQTAAYCTSKGAVIQLTRAMAVDHAAQGVRINAVCPGAVDTPMLESEAEAFGMSAAEGRKLWAADAPNNKLASVHDIAETVTFLACDDARQIHGIALPVDGGATAL